MAWTDVSDTLMQAGRAFYQTLSRNLRDNDEANADKPIVIAFDESKSPGTSYPGSPDATRYCRVPLDAQKLDIKAVGTTASGTLTVKCSIEKTTSPSGSVDSSEDTTTSSTGETLTLAFSDLTSVSGDDLRGQDVTIKLYMKHSAGSTNCTLKNEDAPPSRFYL